MPIAPHIWSSAELFFLIVAVGGCLAFAISLMSVALYVAFGDRAARPRPDTPVVSAPEDSNADLRRAA